MSLSSSSADSAFRSTDDILAGVVNSPQDKESALASSKTESDRTTIRINNQEINLKQANPGDNPAFDLIGLTQLRNEPQYGGIDGSGFSVAVIDTGIDLSHPLIAPNYVAGYDFVDEDDDPSDPQGHGTHVAGIVGATDETIGVAPDVGLIGLRVVDSDGGAMLNDVEDAMSWVLANREQYNITAVNLSLGLGFFTSELEVQGNILLDDIQRLEAEGITVVASTGNDYFANAELPNQANIAAPAISSTIAVGAVWQDNQNRNVSWQSGSIDFTTGADRIASFSQRLTAPNVIFAPGAIITSTLPGGGVGELAGTSQASPHIAGSVALLQEASLQFSDRLLTPDEVTEILRTTGEVIIDGDDEDDNVSNTNNSYFRVNIHNAVAEIKRRSDELIFPPENNSNVFLDHQNSILGSRVYRFFRPELGVHFYTASTAERNHIISNLSNYIYEGESHFSAREIADPLTGAKPVYRFLNTFTGAHIYTISEAEVDNISNNLSNYSYEGIAYYGYESDLPGVTPLYRFYNPVIDAHFYTPSVAERDAVLANLPDYQLENQDGIAFYVEPII
ncbi:MAG: S8 family serine peptidase [Cyanobacteria bacterium P01_G01_bin.67]